MLYIRRYVVTSETNISEQLFRKWTFHIERFIIKRIRTSISGYSLNAICETKKQDFQRIIVRDSIDDTSL
jgi:hypothetical protein